MPGVRIVKVSRVNLPPGSCSFASETITPFSFFDIRWILFQPVQNLLLYPDARLYPSSFHSLKSSLAKTLSLFHPLAGRLAYLSTSDDVVLDCSSEGGVAFVKAVSDVDVRRIAEDDVHDTGAFLKLVPEIAADEMPVQVLAVQVTAFVQGGVAVGVAIHHAAVDGRAFWQFVEARAAECRGDCRAVQYPVPSHDRSVIAVPTKDAIAKWYLSFLAPNRPKLPPTSNKSLQDRLRLTRRTFTLNATAIQSLKRRAMLPLHEKRISPLSRTPSTFEALAPHSWVSLVLAKGLACDAAARDSPAFLFFLANCRARLSLPVNAGYTGNCLRGIKVCATESDLTAPDGHARACAAIAQAVRAVEQEPVRGIEKWPEEFANLPPGIKVSVAGLPRHAEYATDFGWGRPWRVELVSMNFDGEVVLYKGRDEGTVQVSVGIAAQQMEAFAEVFVTQYSCIGRQIMMHLLKHHNLLKLLQSLQ